MGMVVRLVRMWPLLVLLAMLAGIIYLVVTFRHTPERAKEVLIAVFTWFTSIISLLDGNEPVLDLAVSCLILAGVLLGVTLLCRWRFLRNHPNYRWKPMKAKIIHGKRWPWSR